jgi:hypothetical protein
MQGVLLQEGRHECMNFMSPMYGGLCGYEFPDGVPDGIDIMLLIANVSAHGQDIVPQNRNDSVICFICFNGDILLSIVAKHPQIMVIPLLPLIQCAIHQMALVTPLVSLIQNAVHQMVLQENDCASSFLMKGLTLGWMTWVWLEFQPFLQL